MILIPNDQSCLKSYAKFTANHWLFQEREEIIRVIPLHFSYIRHIFVSADTSHWISQTKIFYVDSQAYSFVQLELI